MQPPAKAAAHPRPRRRSTKQVVAPHRANEESTRKFIAATKFGTSAVNPAAARPGPSR